MCNFMPVAKVTPMLPVNHGETLANDLKIKLSLFTLNSGVLHNLRQFIPYTRFKIQN